MATAKIALGSVLDSVAKTAGTISAVFDTANRSINMLDRFVGKASEEQALQYRKDKRTFVKNLVREAAEEQAQADIRVQDFRKQSADHTKFFDESYDEFSALFAEELGLATEHP